ncbi:MAG: GH1 family beta-glucosidase [Fimbriimonadaceae bacterium]|jgi:beta-glucosidase|nr:GH1 family beta-glucosidase [Fimbriimonadaceae bacterium]
MLTQPGRPEKLTFPEGFLWGAATASYQIEGSPLRHGGGASVWDELCKKPGAIMYGDTGFTACDHYTHFREDVKIMADMGLNCYRFSLSWPRIFPDGRGKPNDDGIRFYNDLVDELLKYKIKPLVTLFHWDYPYSLFLKGGWLNPDSPEWFGEYAEAVAGFLGDRVDFWMTQNESLCFTLLGHLGGRHAPGIQYSRKHAFEVVKNALLGHGRSVQALRATPKLKATVSYAPVGTAYRPASESEADINAARQATWSINEHNLSWCPSLFIDPVLKGEWPEDARAVLGEDDPRVTDDELKIMNQPLDVLSLNFYQGGTVRAGVDGPEHVKEAPGYPRTHMDWPVTPESTYWLVRFYHERYGLPIVISENGLSNPDWVHLDGKVHDPNRIDFARRYLQWLHRAANEGYPVLGYTHWSLMDNFEWAEGYRYRFGLVHVDFETLKRTPKDSSFWYKRVIESNGATLYE